MATPNLFEYYKLHPLNIELTADQQPQVFQSWKVSDSVDATPPLPTDVTKPKAVESIRFPGWFLDVSWSKGAKSVKLDPIQKSLSDFVVLLSADRTANAGNIGKRRGIS